MAITVKVSVKDFNSDKLQEELTAASLPIVSISWAGFIPLDSRRWTQFPEASRVVGTSSTSGDDVAAVIGWLIVPDCVANSDNASPLRNTVRQHPLWPRYL